MSCKTVRVHPGTYRPDSRRQALIWLNHKHDGVVVEAAGKVILTAANESLADPEAASYPAIVNHVVYFGDGISRRTVLRGFTITGANNFVTDQGSGTALEPHFDELRSTEGVYGHLFFFTDGGGVKIFGRSYPSLENLEIVSNYASPCGGGISIEHRGFKQDTVRIRNCVFRGNRAMVTGSAIDLLPGSSAMISNCLFTANISNTGNDYVPVRGNIKWPRMAELVRSTTAYLPDHGSGAVTVFPGSIVAIDRCTFTGNFNGLDDRGRGSVIRNSLFWMNTAEGGKRPKGRYELDIGDARFVSQCAIGGRINDVRGRIDPARNWVGCRDPRFDEHWVPREDGFDQYGYRPVAQQPSESR